MTIQVNDKDIVFLGHGSYQGGAKNFALPNGVELYLMQPVGYTMTLAVAEALIGQQPIGKLRLKHDNGSGDADWEPAAPIQGGNLAPDLILHDLGSLRSWGQGVIGNRGNVVTVTGDTLLSALLAGNAAVKNAIKEQQSQGKKLRLFWSACANQVSGNVLTLP